MKNTNAPLRLAVSLGCLLAGFLYWPLWIVGAVALFSLVADIRSAPERRAIAESVVALENSPVTPEDMRDACESPAEVAFLNAMTDAYDLKTGPGALEGGGLRLQSQVGMGRYDCHRCTWQYRVDFVVDGRLVVEIDGAAWHSSDAAIARDRARDATLNDLGYEVLRIPAQLVFRTPKTAIDLVEKSRAALRDSQGRIQAVVSQETTTEVTPESFAVAAVDAGRAVVGAVRAAPSWLGELSEQVDQYNEKAMFRGIVERYFLLVEEVMAAARKHADFMMSVKRRLGKEITNAMRSREFMLAACKIVTHLRSIEMGSEGLAGLSAAIAEAPTTERARGVFEREAEFAVNEHFAKIRPHHEAIFPGAPFFPQGDDAAKTIIIDQIRAAIFDGLDPGCFVHPYVPPRDAIGKSVIARLQLSEWENLVARLRPSASDPLSVFSDPMSQTPHAP